MARPINWRDLYASNQAAIAAAGVPVNWSSPQALVPSLGEPAQRAPTARGGRGSPATRRRETGVHARTHSADRVGDRVLVHVPRGLDPSIPVAAVVMLHGCTQDPNTYAAATAMNDTADRHGFVVMYPGQPRGRNPQACWNWFAPEHQERGAGEPRLIAGLARELLGHEIEQAIDPNRVFVAGLSSGGAMALILAVCYPDLFSAVAVHSGLPYRAADGLASAYAAMGRAKAVRAVDGRAVHAAMGGHARPLPSLVIHGMSDRTVVPQNSGQILAQLMHANHLASPEARVHEPAEPMASLRARAPGGLSYTHNRWNDDDGTPMHESIAVDGLGHAWSGGVPGGSYTDPRGPAASEAIWAFFSQATRPARVAVVTGH